MTIKWVSSALLAIVFIAPLPFEQVYAMCSPTVGQCGGGEVTISQSYSWGSVSGVINTSQQTVNTQTTIQSYPTIPSIVNAAGGIQSLTAYANSSMLQFSVINYDGQQAVQYYVQYTPTHDSGTFIFSPSGALLSGSATALVRLRQEITGENPDIVNQFAALPPSFWQQANSYVVPESQAALSGVQPDIESIQLAACIILGVAAVATVVAFFFFPEILYSLIPYEEPLTGVIYTTVAYCLTGGPVPVRP